MQSRFPHPFFVPIAPPPAVRGHFGENCIFRGVKMVSAVGIESALTSSFKYLQSTDGNESTRKTAVIRPDGL
jgi:hypothetical protein